MTDLTTLEEQVATLERQIAELTERVNRHAHGNAGAQVGYAGDWGTKKGQGAVPDPLLEARNRARYEQDNTRPEELDLDVFTERG